MRHVFERIEFLVVGRDFQPTAPAARAVEEQTAGVRHLTAVNDDLVTVETFVLGGRGADPGNLFNDGLPDAVVEDLEGEPSIWRSQGIRAMTGSVLNWRVAAKDQP
jgi:hypothetical protein